MLLTNLPGLGLTETPVYRLVRHLSKNAQDKANGPQQ